MLRIKNDGKMTIERMLKNFKTKVNKTKLLKELRSREQYDKPSVGKRKEKNLAIYKQKLNLDNNDM